MYTLKVMRCIIVCGLCLISYCNVCAQIIQRIDLEIKGEPIDLLKLSPQEIHLITSTSAYQFSDGQLTHKSDHPTLLNHQTGFTDEGHRFIFNSVFGKGYRLDNKFNYLPLDSEFGDGTLIWNDNYILHTHNKVDYISQNENITLQDFGQNEKQNWLSTFVGGTPVIANSANGIFKLDQNQSLTKLDYNWFAHKPTALAGIGDSLFVGFHGAYSFLIDENVHSIALNRWTGSAPILKFVKHKKKIFILTPDQIIVREGSNHYALDINLQHGDEFIDLVTGANDDLVVLTRNQILLLGSQDNLNYQDLSDTDRTIQLYKIRDRIYYSNGISVFKFNPYTHEWMLNPNKVPPQSIFVDQRGNSFLLFEKEAILLHKDNATLLGNWQLPAERIFNLVDSGEDQFLCTEENLYLHDDGQWVPLSMQKDTFLNVCFSANGIFILSDDHVYELTDEGMMSIENLENESYLSSAFYLADDESILLGTRSGLLQFNTSNNTSKSILKNTNLLDFKIIDDQVYILKPGALIAYNKSELLNGKINIRGIKHFETKFNTGKIYGFNDGYIWISSTSELMRFNLYDFESYDDNVLYLDVVESASRGVIDIANATKFNINPNDLPLRLSYQHRRYQAADDQFKFHIGHNTNKETQWSSDASMVFNYDAAGLYYVQAEMVDGVSNSTLKATPIQIQVLKPSQLNGTTVLIVTLCALLILFLIVRGINRK